MCKYSQSDASCDRFGVFMQQNYTFCVDLGFSVFIHSLPIKSKERLDHDVMYTPTTHTMAMSMTSRTREKWQSTAMLCIVAWVLFKEITV